MHGNWFAAGAMATAGMLAFALPVRAGTGAALAFLSSAAFAAAASRCCCGLSPNWLESIRTADFRYFCGTESARLVLPPSSVQP